MLAALPASSPLAFTKDSSMLYESMIAIGLFIVNSSSILVCTVCRNQEADFTAGDTLLTLLS